MIDADVVYFQTVQLYLFPSNVWKKRMHYYEDSRILEKLRKGHRPPPLLVACI